jgi:hypothetical protein
MTHATRHVLVLAEETAASPSLRAALAARAAQGPVEFTLLVPAADGDRGRAELLVQAVEQLRADGLDVAGQLGDRDPELAVAEVWDPAEFDELLVAGPTGVRRVG